MSATRILYCSKEHFRMYNALCKSEEDKKTKKEKIFATRTPAIFLAAAIGINENESKTVDKDRQLTRREYLVSNENYHAFGSILKSKDGLKTDLEIMEKLMEYAAYGIEVLYDEYHKTGKINFVQITRDIKSMV